MNMSRDLLLMTESREQPVVPELTQSWFEAVKSYSELDNDSAILSQDSLDGVIDWTATMTTQPSGRPESPLKFDHNEIMRIETPSSSAAENVSRHVGHCACVAQKVRWLNACYFVGFFCSRCVFSVSVLNNTCSRAPYMYMYGLCTASVHEVFS